MLVTWHDPCHLGTMSEPFIPDWKGDKVMRRVDMKRTGRKGIYDQPRELIAAIPGMDLVEMGAQKAELGWSSGEADVPISVQFVPSVERCTTNAVSLIELSFQVSFLVAAISMSQSGRHIRRQRHRHRPHHVHLFMAQDVAVVDVLPAEVDQLVDDRRGRVAVRVDVVERRGRRLVGHHRVQRPDAVGQLERQRWG